MRIGFHIEGPLRPDQFKAVVNGIAWLYAIGKPLAGILIVDEPGLILPIKLVSPTTEIVYRWVWGVGDRIPDLKTNPRDEALRDLNIRWYKHVVEAAGADWYQWQNEWWPKDNPAYAAAYYDTILDETWRAGIAPPTVLDLYPGVPENKDFECLYPMLRKAKRMGAAVNYHGYCPYDVDDMAIDSQWWSMRWMLAQATIFPVDLRDLIVIIGEASNAHGYLPGRTLSLMQQEDDLLIPYPFVKFVAWYELNNPQAGTKWAMFNYYDMLPAFFAWAAARS